MNPRSMLLAGLAAVGLLAAPAAAEFTNEVHVSKTSGLKDGAQVEVHLQGWSGEIPQIDLVQCTPNAQSIADCALAESQSTVIMDFGEGKATIGLHTLDTYVRCDKTHDCALVAFTNPADFSKGATFTKLSFNDDAHGGTFPAASGGNGGKDQGPNKLLWALILPAGAAGVLALRRNTERQPAHR